MPELPEIVTLTRNMQKELAGRTITGVEILQPKCLNLPEDDFLSAVEGARLLRVTSHGKWIQANLDNGWLLFNLGMGGEILLTDRDHLPEKHRLILDLQDGASLAVNFWWFGNVHYVKHLADHKQVAGLGPDFMSLTIDDFCALLRGRRGGIKAFLLNQKQIAGIGNVYGQDPLFKARIHPLRAINTLTGDEIEALYHAIRETLQESIDHGGAAYELNLYGEHGGWDNSFLLVAYREGEPCPACGTTIEKIKTGSTSTHICPSCQRLKPNG